MTTRLHPLTEARQKHGWTRRKLAQKVGVSPGMITRIEKWERVPSVEVLTNLASVLGWPDAAWLQRWLEEEEGSG